MERMRLVKELQEYLSSYIDCDENKAICELVWSMIIAFEGYTFQTYKGLSFRYQVRGKELFVNWKEKFKVFGSSYLWAMFKRFGLLVLF